jgi:glycosyltransferase involved in cell wall biosynthesis
MVFTHSTHNTTRNKKDGMKTGIVVIGRNEGERLVACLRSLPIGQYPAVYVDSGSSDGSLERARNLGALSIKLDNSIPFSAARARNEGVQRIARDNPSIKYVQFVDGDCMICNGWLESAADALEGDESLAAVFGRIEEMSPGKSIYNRLCLLEWQSPAGKIQSCGAFGGNSMIRLRAFIEVGGFNHQVIAGEDAELAARMLLAKYRIEKLDLPMVRHDADITRFAQWWRRSVRSGHAIGQRAHIHGNSILKDCLRERRSVMIWGMAVPFLIVAGSLISAWLGAAIAALYGVLAFRIWRFRQRRGNSARDAAIYAAFTVLGKLPEAFGLLRFWRNQFARHYQIIEYK